jgi:hypothetical protein
MSNIKNAYMEIFEEEGLDENEVTSEFSKWQAECWLKENKERLWLASQSL